MDWDTEESAKDAKSGRVDQLQVIKQALQNLIIVFDPKWDSLSFANNNKNRKCLAWVGASIFFAKNIVVYRSLSHLLFCISAVFFVSPFLHSAQIRETDKAKSCFCAHCNENWDRAHSDTCNCTLIDVSLVQIEREKTKKWIKTEWLI